MSEIKYQYNVNGMDELVKKIDENTVRISLGKSYQFVSKDEIMEHIELQTEYLELLLRARDLFLCTNNYTCADCDCTPSFDNYDIT